MVGIDRMTIGFQFAVYLEMPHWLEAMEVISAEHWMAITQCLNVTATVGLH